MRLSRAFPVALALAVWPLAPAMAQFGGMPGMPGAPGGPGAPGMPGSPFGAAPPPSAPPPQCQQLITYRDEAQKQGQVLSEAGKKKAPPEESCKLFKNFLAAEGKLVKGLEENSAACGVPPEVLKQVKASHAKATQIGKQVCDMAAQGPRPAAPSLSDALGTTPVVPDTTTTKRGAGTFDTLEGSPLTR
jgi:hypothetical protein